MIWEDNALLMVDNRLIASETNTSMVREEAWKHEANPIIHEGCKALFAGRKGYRIWPACVNLESGILRMWYRFETQGPRALSGLAYAESRDGINFKTVRRSGGPLVHVTDRTDVGFGGMMHDPVDREFPYKMVVTRRRPWQEVNPALLAKWPDLRQGECELVWGVALSRDGFSWQLPSHDHNLIDCDIEGPDIFRSMDGGYVISNQMRHPMARLGGRKVKGWLTYDFQKAHRIPDFVFALPDHMVRTNRQFTGPDWPDIPWAQSHVGLVAAKHGPTVMALHGYLYMCYGPAGVETYAQVADVGLAISSTGLEFSDVWPFCPVLRRGDRGRWDSGLLVQGPMVQYRDQTRIYYFASDVGNAGGCAYRAGLAWFRRDGYGYRVLKVYRDYEETKERRGILTLKPVALPDKPAFYVNVSHVTKHRTVRLELADDRGRALRGYRFADSLPVTREGVRQPISWKNGRTGSELAGKQVVIRVELYSPDCQFADQHSPRLYAVYMA